MSKKLLANIGATVLREKILSLLLLSFLILIIHDRSFLNRIPRYIDYNSLSLIIYYLVLSRGLVMSGVTEDVAIKLMCIVRGHMRKAVLGLILSTFFLSMFITNDGAVLILVPLSLALARNLGIKTSRIIVLVLLAANTGSMALPFGNPQNIIVWQHYKVGFFSLASVTLPFSIIGLSTLIAYTFLLIPSKKYEFYAGARPGVFINRKLSVASFFLLFFGIVFGELRLGLFALAIEVLVFLLIEKNVLKGVNTYLILMFILIFPVFGEIAYIISQHNILVAISSFISVYLVTIVLSQVISNVPATIALSHIIMGWKTLVIAANVSGYITPIGSIANIIGIRLSGINGREYIKRTLIYSISMCLIGFLYIVIIRAMG